ncbi:MAG: sugar phosphate isomerase/epimerase [Bryobacterales bacterium]|nr:sugar phosphate isomerase/epimerase [Bryobacterales bacterium]
MQATASAALLSAKGKKIPIGLELYSVRQELQKDDVGTVKAVARMGYDAVEFFSPYTGWTVEKAKEMRKLLDDLGVKCLSTHNGAPAFAPDKIDHTIALNTILGSKLVVMASAGRVQGLDGWKGVAEKLNAGAEKMKPAGIRAGFHNHKSEFVALEGKMPMEVLAAETGKNVVLQLDVGTCVEAGVDPVEWIKKHPGRFASIHCKDWSKDPAIGFKALFGEGDAPWKKIFAAAEKAGGVECYMVEQEGSRYTPMETAEKCLANIRKLRG